jgi:hypothetical protein
MAIILGIGELLGGTSIPHRTRLQGRGVLKRENNKMRNLRAS